MPLIECIITVDYSNLFYVFSRFGFGNNIHVTLSIIHEMIFFFNLHPVHKSLILGVTLEPGRKY